MLVRSSNTSDSSKRRSFVILLLHGCTSHESALYFNRLHLNSSVKYVHAIARLSTCPFEAGFKTNRIRISTYISIFLQCRSLQYTLTIKTHRFICNYSREREYCLAPFAFSFPVVILLDVSRLIPPANLSGRTEATSSWREYQWSKRRPANWTTSMYIFAL